MCRLHPACTSLLEEGGCNLFKGAARCRMGKGAIQMEKGLHPRYEETKVVCACGNVIVTASTVKDLRVEICSACHPFFPGKQKLVDSAGRIDRFNRRYKIRG